MPGLWDPFEEERDKGIWQGRYRVQGQWLLQERQRSELQKLVVERLIKFVVVEERFIQEKRLVLEEGFIEFLYVVVLGLVIRRFRVQVPGAYNERSGLALALKEVPRSEPRFVSQIFGERNVANAIRVVNLGVHGAPFGV